MNNTFSLLFYPKRSMVDRANKVSVYLRNTVNGRRSELSINRKIELSQWNRQAGKVIGTNNISRDLTHTICQIQSNEQRACHLKYFSNITINLFKMY